MTLKEAEAICEMQMAAKPGKCGCGKAIPAARKKDFTTCSDRCDQVFDRASKMVVEDIYGQMFPEKAGKKRSRR